MTTELANPQSKVPHLTDKKSTPMLTPEQARFASGCQPKPISKPPPVLPPEYADTTATTKAQALDALGNKRKSQRDTEICNIVIAAFRNGVADLSGREIQQRYEFEHSRRIDTSTISGAICRLVTAKRLERGPARTCAVTGSNIVPVRPVAHQVRL